VRSAVPRQITQTELVGGFNPSEKKIGNLPHIGVKIKNV